MYNLNAENVVRVAQKFWRHLLEKFNIVQVFLYVCIGYQGDFIWLQIYCLLDTNLLTHFLVQDFNYL